MRKTFLGFNEQQINKHFPFYLVFGQDLTITSQGAYVQKLFHSKLNTSLTRNFKILNLAKENMTFTTLCKLADKPVELISTNNSAIKLAGSFDHITSSNELIFIGTPTIHIGKKEAKKAPHAQRFTNNLSPERLSIPQQELDKYFTTAKPSSKAIDESAFGIVIMNVNGEIEWANQSMERTTGYSLQEMAGKRPRHVLYGKDSIHVPLDYVDSMTELREPFTFENLAYTKTGKKFWFRASVHPIINEENEITGRFSVLEDITDIKERENEIAQNNEMWRNAFESAGHGVWTHSYLDHTFIFSREFKKMLGYGPDEEFGTSEWSKAIHPDDLSEFLNEIFPKISRTNPKFVHEHRLMCKDGKYKHFATRAEITDWDANGAPIKSAGTLTDITERVIKDQQLKITTERLSSLIQHFSSGVILEDEHGNVLLSNEQFCTMFSIPLTPQQMVGVACAAALEQIAHIFRHPGQVIEDVRNLIAEKILVTDEQVELTDGRILQRDYIPIYHEAQYMGNLWKYRDITDQVNEQHKLLAQKEYYHKLLDQIPADITIFTHDHKYEFLNKSAVKNDELRHWMIGKNDYDYCELKKIDRKFADNRRDCFDKAVNSKQPQKIVEEQLNADGTLKYTVRVMHPYVNEQNIIEFVIGYGIDVTEQIRNERYAEVQEKRIRNLLEIINDGVVRCEEDGRINVFNRAFLKIMEINAEQQKEKLNFFDIVPEAAQQELIDKVNIVKRNGTIKTGMFSFTSALGSEKFIDYTITPVIRAEDAAFVVRLSDITDAVNRENNLNGIIEKEKDLNSAKSRFIHITSHELRTPLAIIQANTELLGMILNKEVPVSASLYPEKMLDRINKEVIIITDILNQLMMVSKIESGNVELAKERSCILAFVNGIKTDLYEPYTDGRTLIIESELQASALRFDKKLLRLAIVNILNNAFKYSAGKPSPILKLSRAEGNCIFEIQDFGIGIPENDKLNLFRSFYRATNVGIIQGTGLGLNVVDYAIKKHNGHISFKSEINQGSVFTISIPANDEDDE